MANNKWLVVVMMVLMANNIFSMHDKKESILARLVTHYPVTLLSGGYFLTKDRVCYQLNAYTPHLFATTGEASMIFPSQDFYRFHANAGKTIWQYGRYRNVGLCFLVSVLLSDTFIRKS